MTLIDEAILFSKYSCTSTKLCCVLGHHQCLHPIQNSSSPQANISLSISIVQYPTPSYVCIHCSKFLGASSDFSLLNIISIFLIIICYLGFIYLTYKPSHNFIFYDTVDRKYGVREYVIE